MSSAVNDNTDLPKGWKIQTIENLFKIKSGEFLSAQMMDENGLYDVYGGNGINGKYNKYNLRDENIIIGRVGANCGNVRLVNDKLWITDNAFYISEYFKDINKKYLYNFLSYIELGKTSNTSAQPVISYKGIKDIEIPLPPLPEQQRIVEKLDRLFANIDTAIALSEENLQHTNNLLPAALNEVFENAEEKGWKIEKLKNITTKIGSGSTPTGGHNSYKQTGISLIRSMNVYDNGFDKDGLAFIDEIQARKLDAVTIEEDDVLLNITGASVARCCIVPKEILPARVNQHVSIIRFRKNTVVPKFAHYYFICPTIKNQLLKDSGGGATREAITKSMLENFDITFPDLPTQQKIVQHLNALSAQQQQLQQHYTQQLQQLKALKASLLHAAFRGEL